MALIFYGKSTCPLCSKVLQQGDDVTGFAAFIPNTADPLYVFNDAGLHTACVKADKRGQLALEYMREYTSGGRPNERLCVVSGKPVNNPEDFIFIPLLTSDTGEPLFNYRFITINRRYLSEWKQREEFLLELRKFKDSGKWKEFTEGTAFIDGLIKQVNL